MFSFAKGDEVVLKNRPEAGTGVVTGVVLAGDEPQYRVRFNGGAQLYSARHLALPMNMSRASDDPLDVFRDGRLGDAEAFRAYMSLVKLETPLASNLYSFAASRTQRLPHQFKAVLKLLANPHGRLLIADEVGLGKTIEAGIILTELQARRPLDHVLIVCPSPLTAKWRQEMRNRFLFDFEVLDGQRFREFVEADKEGPATEPRRVIASIELLRRAENLEALVMASPNLDVVVVDEAHHMRNVNTASNDLGEALCHLAEIAVFLTATPLNLGRTDFFTLMHLLSPEDLPQFETFIDVIEPNRHINAALRQLRAGWPPDLAAASRELRRLEKSTLRERFLASARYTLLRHRVDAALDGAPFDRDEVVGWQRDLIELNTLSSIFTRTRKREVQERFPTRRSATVAVEFTSAEQAFYDAVTAWALETYADRAAHLVAVTFQRLAASCLPALGTRLVETARYRTLSLDADEVAELQADGLDRLTLDDAEQGVDLEVSEPSALDTLLATWRAYQGRTDSKYDGFERALRASFDEGGDRVLVFSYFTGTIDYLARRLDGLRVAGTPLKVLKLYGPMSSEQRDRAVTEFRDGAGPVVLLSSEVGSEGLDFQFCSRMFNYDLPWNPMRVEQRIGRLDRFGQQSELIHINNMIVSGSIEERIFYRLYERIRIFETSIGDLEAILGDVETDLGRLQRDALSGRLTDDEIERRRNQIADIIVRRQQDNEEFERESRQLLSNDDVFLDRFNDIEKSRRYVTPDELELLVRRFLDVSGACVTLTPVAGRPGVLALRGDCAALRRTVIRALADAPLIAKGATAFAARLHDEGMSVTFDPTVATEARSLEFISLHHPLVRALASSEDLRGEVSCCGAFAVDLELAGPDPLAFFVFELEAKGLKDEVEQLAVVVDADGGVDERAGGAVLASLDRARPVTLTPLPPAEVDRRFGKALTRVAGIVASREQELQQRNDETINAQIDSLRLSTDRRRVWLKEQIAEGRSASIVRMRRAQLSRLEHEYDAKRAALETKRGVSVGYRLVAAGLVTR